MKRCPVCGENMNFSIKFNTSHCQNCGYVKPLLLDKEDICPCCGEKENITIIHERICNNCGINF